VDNEENLMFANKSLLEYFSVDKEAFGKKLDKIIPLPIAALFHEKHSFVLSGGLQDQGIVKSVMADGKEHVYQVLIFPIGDNVAGRMVGGEALDITEAWHARKLETQMAKDKLKQQKKIAEAIIQAQEQERARIGHELHDNVNQILSSGQLYLNHLTQGLENFEDVKDKTLDIIKLAIEEIRNLSRAMVAPDLDQDGLVISIHELVEDLRFSGLFYISFSHGKMADLELISQSKKITLFRIIQEQTRNIVKYSKAKNVEISLFCCDDQVRLEIADDGKGFDPKNTRRGLGLSNIYERTRLYNGKVLLTTAPGKGCSIIVNIPFETRDTSMMNIRKH
jgi:signal transduction histidine kinase